MRFEAVYTIAERVEDDLATAVILLMDIAGLYMWNRIPFQVGIDDWTKDLYKGVETAGSRGMSLTKASFAVT